MPKGKPQVINITIFGWKVVFFDMIFATELLNSMLPLLLD
jgi:hypothetical protein